MILNKTVANFLVMESKFIRQCCNTHCNITMDLIQGHIEPIAVGNDKESSVRSSTVFKQKRRFNQWAQALKDILSLKTVNRGQWCNSRWAIIQIEQTKKLSMTELFFSHRWHPYQWSCLQRGIQTGWDFVTYKMDCVGFDQRRVEFWPSFFIFFSSLF